MNAPREQAPSGSADASILLATIYGGYGNSTAMALATAANPTLNQGSTTGVGLYGSLTLAMIAQIIVNTETNAIAAFSGTSLPLEPHQPLRGGWLLQRNAANARSKPPRPIRSTRTSWWQAPERT